MSNNTWQSAEDLKDTDNSGSTVGVQRPLNRFEGESIEDPYRGSCLSDRRVIPGQIRCSAGRSMSCGAQKEGEGSEIGAKSAVGWPVDARSV